MFASIKQSWARNRTMSGMALVVLVLVLSAGLGMAVRSTVAQDDARSKAPGEITACIGGNRVMKIAKKGGECPKKGTRTLTWNQQSPGGSAETWVDRKTFDSDAGLIHETVTCSDNGIATGGGYAFSGTKTVIQNNHPSPTGSQPTGWAVRAVGPDHISVEIFVVCAPGS